MAKQISHTEAIENFAQLCEEAISTGEAIEITREDAESVSIISTAELESLRETVYLFSSHANAVRLLDALERAQSRTNQPRTLDSLHAEYYYYDR
ncbi:type II toxin-antitoxin system Phd/YefM family antitoxin [Leptolyngbya sp. NIES-2104]|uniref:type II toxin-antitoxin system Phd/YefM family antitoxin n=1 Tax=Leptolyngbya sp. NIES-2104 TaxID=1552121 RepID=UPI0006ECA49E|nr:type II toxin-antitoxin system Phd/YefM family antitoxin [Leptolyngbya sp. NIES-2104]GAP95462.1 YefM protein [Leptolyngbya sp. NIES-2104]